MRFVSVLVLSSVFAGCVGGPPDAFPERTTIPVFYGSRAPTTFDMPVGYRLAIGWLAKTKEPERAFCSGTLIAVSTVLTAAHCVDRTSPERVVFGVGADPERPAAHFDVTEITIHQDADLALLTLKADATSVVPELLVLPRTWQELTESDIGDQVEVAGFGRTHDGQTGRFFVGVRLSGLDTRFAVVDGEGQRGLCFGDSGGPLLVQTDAGPAVAAVVHAGDASCVGVDRLTRVDGPDAFFDRAPGPVSDECIGIDYLGVCRGNVAVWCEARRLETFDCTETDQQCGWLDDRLGVFCADLVESNRD